LEDLGTDERIIVNWIFKKWYQGMDWILQAPNRDRWRAAVNAIMTFGIPLHVQGIS
jgi:hypothetical protein